MALLLAIIPGLPSSQYRRVLVNTSYPWSYEREATFETGESPRVVDVSKAADYLLSRGGDAST